jgi:hypothetical protein
MVKKIGLIAGVGRLPVEFARAARNKGFIVIAVAVVPGVDDELAVVTDQLYHIGVGQLDAILTVLKKEEITAVTMLGKVTKELMFTGTISLDGRMQKLLAGLKDHSDDTLMLAFVRELASEGLEALDQTALIASLMPPPGVLTQRAPTPAEQADMEFGLAMAKQIGSLDIGQTVVVKNRAVIAVEAIEGTDACIRRGGQLAKGGVTVAKAAKPKQDLRFDVPGIGPDTIVAMLETGAIALVIEAGKTLLVQQETVLRLADEHAITIVAM